jgi:hypothetical protein
MQQVHCWLDARGGELRAFAALLQDAAAAGRAPDFAGAPRDVLRTGAVAAALVLLLLLPRGRRAVLGTLDTLLATALCGVLLLLLVALPLGETEAGGRFQALGIRRRRAGMRHGGKPKAQQARAQPTGWASSMAVHGLVARHKTGRCA